MLLGPLGGLDKKRVHFLFQQKLASRRKTKENTKISLLGAHKRAQFGFNLNNKKIRVSVLVSVCLSHIATSTPVPHYAIQRKLSLRGLLGTVREFSWISGISQTVPYFWNF